MFLNVVMMLLPLRGYRQGCHRSPTWTALPIVIGIVLGSHRLIFHYLFWTFFNGPSPLNPWPFSIGPHLNLNVSITGRRLKEIKCTCSSFVLLYPRIILRVRGVCPFPPDICVKGGCLLTVLAFSAFWPSTPFQLGPYLLRTGPTC